MLKKITKINAVVLAIVLTCLVFSQTGQGYISNELSLDQQSSLRGGGCNEYCELGSTGCRTVPDCGEGDFCLEGLLVCPDSTLAEYCEYAGSGYCTAEEFGHFCTNKRELTGSCYKGQICNTSFYNLGSCFNAGAPEFVPRCH